ncbi:MAG TPA: hypothetical protein VFC92_09535 [Bacteroidales bacterium]|nr:hypothetical protein [Bacteroidales bacterium]
MNSVKQLRFIFKRRDYGTTLRTGTYLLTLYNNGQQITTVKVQKQRF